MNFVLVILLFKGNKQGVEDIDKELLNWLKKQKKK